MNLPLESLVLPPQKQPWDMHWQTSWAHPVLAWGQQDTKWGEMAEPGVWMGMCPGFLVFGEYFHSWWEEPNDRVVRPLPKS